MSTLSSVAGNRCTELAVVEHMEEVESCIFRDIDICSAMSTENYSKSGISTTLPVQGETREIIRLGRSTGLTEALFL